MYEKTQISAKRVYSEHHVDFVSISLFILTKIIYIIYYVLHQLHKALNLLMLVLSISEKKTT